MVFELSEDRLVEFLRSGKDWGRLRTSVPGVFVLKLPAYKGSPSRLAIELNPVGEDGLPKKKRGLVLRSKAELEDFRIFIFLLSCEGIHFKNTWSCN